MSRNQIRGALYDLDQWVKPEKASKTLVTLMDKMFIKPEPYGTVLLISPWNYPVQLVIGPLVGAISAGNTVVIKPSEVAPATAAVFAELLPRYIDPVCEDSSRLVSSLEGRNFKCFKFYH